MYPGRKINIKFRFKREYQKKDSKRGKKFIFASHIYRTIRSKKGIFVWDVHLNTGKLEK